ncbi:MAG: hypothetical protein ACREMZ_15610 [Gemmatimonadales bacterium]
MNNRRSIRVGLSRFAWALPLTLALACGGDGATGPTDTVYGETTAVYMLNPVVNDLSAVAVPAPGTTQSGVEAAITDGPSGTTGSTGDAVLAPIAAGTRIASFTSTEGSGQLSLEIAEGDLREIAVALDATGAAAMANVLYAFGGTVVEITPTMTNAEVNAALSGSNLIVFLRAGTYQGNLDFSGSNVTLFGEGAQGGSVTIDGNVTVSGSGNRVRGARITGDLSVPGSSAGISYSRVVGALTVDGSNVVLLKNAFCGAATVGGSGLLALGNAGLAPLPAPGGGC